MPNYCLGKVLRSVLFLIADAEISVFFYSSQGGSYEKIQHGVVSSFIPDSNYSTGAGGR